MRSLESVFTNKNKHKVLVELNRQERGETEIVMSFQRKRQRLNEIKEGGARDRNMKNKHCSPYKTFKNWHLQSEKRSDTWTEKIRR